MTKLLIRQIAISLCFTFCATSSLTAQPITDPQGDIGVGTIAPDPSAILELNSTTKGFLLPRLTTTQMNVIPLPANGLMIFNTDLGLHKSGAMYQDSSSGMPFSQPGTTLVGQRSAMVGLLMVSTTSLAHMTPFQSVSLPTIRNV